LRVKKGKEPTRPKRFAPPPKRSPKDPVVTDNFGKTMRVTKAELRVFETYFGDLLYELFEKAKKGGKGDAE
jgi:hypothetical protein